MGIRYILTTSLIQRFVQSGLATNKLASFNFHASVYKTVYKSPSPGVSHDSWPLSKNGALARSEYKHDSITHSFSPEWIQLLNKPSPTHFPDLVSQVFPFIWEMLLYDIQSGRMNLLTICAMVDK